VGDPISWGGASPWDRDRTVKLNALSFEPETEPIKVLKPTRSQARVGRNWDAAVPSF